MATSDYKAIKIARRRFLKGLGLLSILAAMRPVNIWAKNTAIITRRIPVSGEKIPAIGMGSWLTFGIGNEPEKLATRVAILRSFFAGGGYLIDSSPMYGNAEKVIGECLATIQPFSLFAATKVWTSGWQQGIRQMETSRRLWGLPRFDLLQIHNLLDWKVHIETLKAWKQEGKVRYIGVTTSHGRRHDELEMIMRTQPIDFVQFTYNILDREAEARLLPLAKDKGIAVIVNRPFQGGELFPYTVRKNLPGMASELQIENWAQFFLKYIISHPAVTCAIPATSQVQHMQENIAACYGPLPDKAMRAEMQKAFKPFL